MSTLTYEPTDLPTPEPLPPWMFDAEVEVQELFVAWQSAQQGRAVPALADLDLDDLRARFRGLIFARPTPEGGANGYLFHPLEPVETGMLGTERGLAPELFHHIPLAGCRTALNKRAPFVDRLGALSTNGMLLDYEIAFLPLSSDGVAIDWIMILAVEIEAADRL